MTSVCLSVRLSPSFFRRTRSRVIWQQVTSLFSSYSPGGTRRRELARVRCICDTHLGWEEEVVGVSDGTIRKSDGSFLYTLGVHCDHCAISDHSAAVWRRMSPTLQSTDGICHFGTKFGEVVVDRCKPNLNTIWERHGAVVGKRNRVAIFSRLSTIIVLKRLKIATRCTNVTLAHRETTER